MSEPPNTSDIAGTSSIAADCVLPPLPTRQQFLKVRDREISLIEKKKRAAKQEQRDLDIRISTAAFSPQEWVAIDDTICTVIGRLMARANVNSHQFDPEHIIRAASSANPSDRESSSSVRDFSHLGQSGSSEQCSRIYEVLCSRYRECTHIHVCRVYGNVSGQGGSIQITFKSRADDVEVVNDTDSEQSSDDD